MNSEKLLIVGCGDLGQRLARELSDLPYEITGLRRHPPGVAPEYLQYLAGDIANMETRTMLAHEHFSVVVVTMTPSERSDEGYRQAYVETCRTLIDAFQQRPPRLFVFVSSTSVYSQNDGSFVHEESPTQPTSFSGKRLLEAEGIVRNSGFTHTIVRFSGIYGPGRNRLLEQVQAGRATASSAYTNRIHADDCAAVLAHLLERHRQGKNLLPAYLATDSVPATSQEVVCWLAQRLGVSVSELVTAPQLNKRCSNNRLLASGYIFRYPDYRAGYAALLAATELTDQ